MLFFTHFPAVGGYETERVTLNMVWNRFCNSKGRPRGSIGLDLVNEHLNKEFKGKKWDSLVISNTNDRLRAITAYNKAQHSTPFKPFTCYIFHSQPRHKLTFHVIPPHWHDTGSSNPSSSKTITYLFHIINVMADDVLATQGASASTTMILTMMNRINSVTAR